MTGRIIQFGTSRFLQAHAAFFVHEARQAGQSVGPITVVQTSDSRDRTGRVAAFGRPDGYPVVIRGVVGTQKVDRTVQVTSVDRGLSARDDWAEVSRLFAEDADFIISNTGDTGYRLFPEDAALPDGDVPRSFPAKLAALLRLRWQGAAAPLVFLPCELVTGNGQALKKVVIESARQNAMPDGFFDWLDREVVFADTLVDRIVSEPIEPVGAVAEPYALWAIRKAPGVRLPCRHESILLVDDLEPYERLKLHILNLGHTYIADLWATGQRPADETVRAILADAHVRDWLETLYETEVIPGFAAKGMGAEARAYVATTLDRFLNPFLDHRIADIAQHHTQKVERRIATFLDWVSQSAQPHEAPILREMVSRFATPGAAA